MIINITKVRSSDLLEDIFGYLGKFSLDSVARKFLWELRESGKGAFDMNKMIFLNVDSLYNNM